MSGGILPPYSIEIPTSGEKSTPVVFFFLFRRALNAPFSIWNAVRRHPGKQPQQEFGSVPYLAADIFAAKGSMQDAYFLSSP